MSQSAWDDVPVPPLPFEVDDHVPYALRCLHASWAFVDFEIGHFHDALSGPLRTAPETEPGHGGCAALSPRSDPRRTSNKLYNWNRWWLAMDRRHKRAGRRRLLLASLGCDPRALGVPSWRT